MTTGGTPLYDALHCDRLDLDDTTSCDSCGADAERRVTIRCCETMIAFLCHTHYGQVRAGGEQFLTPAHGQYCVTCRRVVPAGAGFDDVYRTVRL